jgi:hypothetical protein
MLPEGMDFKELNEDNLEISQSEYMKQQQKLMKEFAKQQKLQKEK